MARRWVVAAVLCATAATAGAQPGGRRTTNVAALLAYPGFYHLRPVLVTGMLALSSNGELRVSSDNGSLPVLATKGLATPEGLDEIRGEFWDVGRMGPNDPQLASYDLKSSLHIDPDAAWPRPGQVVAIHATAIVKATPPAAPSIRAVVLFPDRYTDQTITLVGQFAGRNLLGDLPDAPGRSKYDFVVRSTDAAVWVSNLRPKGKDFELALDSRIDTGRWVEVSGVVKQGRGLQWLDALMGLIKLTKPPIDTLQDDAPVQVPPGPPPEVVFSAPTEGETDVQLTATVRIQFSRDLDQATIRGHVKVTYSAAETAVRGEFVTPTANVTTQYNAGNRVLELRFMEPLERFRIVKVELLDGILGTDGQGLKPWTLTFQTGP